MTQCTGSLAHVLQIVTAGLAVRTSCVPSHSVDLGGKCPRFDDGCSPPRRHGQQISVTGDHDQRTGFGGEVEYQVVLVIGAVMHDARDLGNEAAATVLSCRRQGLQVLLGLGLLPLEKLG